MTFFTSNLLYKKRHGWQGVGSLASLIRPIVNSLEVFTIPRA